MNDDEVEDDGRLFPDLGSLHTNNLPIRIRFYNLCADPVDVFWLNSQREPTRYGTLGRRQFLDIRTYENHPWVARRSFDGCKLQLNKKAVFWPEPAVPNVIVRASCLITMKVQTLKEIAARSLLHQNRDEVSKKMEELPRELQHEVNSLLATKEEYSRIVCRSIQPLPPR